MHNVVRLPVHPHPHPRPVEDPAAEPLPAAIDERHEISARVAATLLLLTLPWLLAISILMPRRRRP